ncbi:MAG TPA: hypothetical protein VMF50_04425 [Candidatus Binataceae bacterium]|nr:hypothetical protein [Candidatus Binataceae bacterium]
MRKLPVSGELIEEAKKLGISLQGLGLDAVPMPDSKEKEMQATNQVRGRYNEAKLQRRLLEFKRDQRDKRIWLFALLSMSASVVSA